MGLFKKTKRKINQAIDLKHEKTLLEEQKKKLDQDNRQEKLKQEINEIDEKSKIISQKNKKLARGWLLADSIILIIVIVFSILYYMIQYRNYENDIEKYRADWKGKITEYQSSFKEEENMLKEHLGN